MKIFLTGASGFIGGSVGARLAAAGHHLRGLVRDQRTRPGVVPRPWPGCPSIGA